MGMGIAGSSGAQWMLFVQHELLLFAAIFFLIGALDEFAIDILYLLMRATGRIRTERVDAETLAAGKLSGPVAVFVPCWREALVIGATIRHARTVWPDAGIAFYIGCYRDDPETRAAAKAAAQGDPRVRTVVNDADGPTSKADCLNTLYAAMERDELVAGRRMRMVVLHDAEDMVDPLAIKAMDAAMTGTGAARAAFVQLPVLALPKADSRFIAGHYVDEFAETHCALPALRLVA